MTLNTLVVVEKLQLFKSDSYGLISSVNQAETKRMKIYKDLSLNTCTQRQRFLHILKTGEIWFSKFHALADPMEGTYYTYASKEIKQVFASEKNNNDARSAYDLRDLREMEE